MLENTVKEFADQRGETVVEYLRGKGLSGERNVRTEDEGFFVGPSLEILVGSR